MTWTTVPLPVTFGLCNKCIVLVPASSVTQIERGPKMYFKMVKGHSKSPEMVSVSTAYASSYTMSLYLLCLHLVRFIFVR